MTMYIVRQINGTEDVGEVLRRPTAVEAVRAAQKHFEHAGNLVRWRLVREDRSDLSDGEAYAAWRDA